MHSIQHPYCSTVVATALYKKLSYRRERALQAAAISNSHPIATVPYADLMPALVVILSNFQMNLTTPKTRMMRMVRLSEGEDLVILA